MAIGSNALDPRALGALALHRFGFGPRPGDLDRIVAGPRGALLGELKYGNANIDNAQLLNSGAALRATVRFQQERKAAREAQRMAGGGNDMSDDAQPMQKPGPGVPQRIYLAEAQARYNAALSAETGFVERLVWFWSNHFCVSADKGPVRGLCGAYEREAIRPHVLGKFFDMLLAVETHPAMLLYVDKARSIGPNSIAGVRRGTGL